MWPLPTTSTVSVNKLGLRLFFRFLLHNVAKRAIANNDLLLKRERICLNAVCEGSFNSSRIVQQQRTVTAEAEASKFQRNLETH